MGRTKKIGIAGKFGARYGSTLRKRFRDIEEKMKKKHTCPSCFTSAVKRVFAGVWKCKKCGRTFAGGAYLPFTAVGKSITRTVRRIKEEAEEETVEVVEK
ncbi:MAG: 50S ribosomal protein L37Ae [Asgard group archaeon]